MSYQQGTNKGNDKSAWNLSNLSNSFNFGDFSTTSTSPFLTHHQNDEKNGSNILSPSKDQKVYDGKNRHHHNSNAIGEHISKSAPLSNSPLSTSPNTLTLFSGSGKTVAETVSPTFESHLGTIDLDPLYLDFEFDNFDDSRTRSYSVTSSKSGGDEDDLFSFMGGMDGIDYSGNYNNPDDIGGLKFLSQSYSPKSSKSMINSSLLETHSSFKDNSFVEHPLGEHPSRTLFVRNISSNLDDDELKQLFENFGQIRNLYTSCKHRGFIMVSYYDIRHAKGAMKNLQGKTIKRRKLDIHYSIPKDNPPERDLNQGTLVVFNLDSTISNEELKIIFGKYGEVKEIRETPNKKHHKFIEFYDVREADKAMKALNKIEVKGKKIKIEPSRPGGTRKNMYLNVDTKSIDSPHPNESPSLSSPDILLNQSPHTLGSPSLKKEDIPTERIRSRNRINSVEEKKKFSLDLDRVKYGDDVRTTLMIKNIPNKYTQKMLLQTIDIKFKGSYDFFYLPIDFKNRCNVGYSFINFIDPISIIQFCKELNGKKWEKFNSEKVCELTYARIQGKLNLIEHFQNSSLMSEETSCRPIIFHSDGPNIGKEQPFPLLPIKQNNYKKKKNKK
eukprot:gene6922-11085_t